MSTHVGPTRLVVIRSGKYDYGEIDLTEAVHLVGPNNVGKTSLIALLQLLYVDSQKHMTFSRPLDESKRYYFPDTNSYVLFEVLTPTGFMVLGAHGLGKVKRNDFERFAYQGRFDPADYLDEERRVREAQEIKARLAPRQYVELQPKHLRAALTGLGDSRNVNLGLVPLRHRDQYERFRAVFQHLLRLAQIRQAELKSLLLEIYRNSFRQHSIDLGREVAEQLRIIRTNQAEVRKLKALQPDVERLLVAVKSRDTARTPLPGLWLQVGIATSQQEQKLAQEQADQDAREHQLKEDEQRTLAELECHNTEHIELVKLTAQIEDQLARHETDRQRFRGFVLEFKEQGLVDLERQIEDLTVRLHSGHQETATQVKQRLQRYRRERLELDARLANLAGSVGARIAELLPQAQDRAAVFKLIDARMLQLPVGDVGLLVTDEDALRRWLDHTQQRLADGIFSGCGVRIDLSALPEPDLDEYLNADRIATELAGLDREIARLEGAVQALKDAEQLGQRLDELKLQRNTLVQELADWNRHQQDLSTEPGLKADLAEAIQTLADLDSTRQQARTLLQSITVHRHDLETLRAETLQQRSEFRETLAQLVAPSKDWQSAAFGDGTSDEEQANSGTEGTGNTLCFADLATRYTRLYEEQHRHDSRVQDHLRIIDERTYGKYADNDETAIIEKLRRELEALPEKETSTDQLWHALAVGLRSQFKQLWQDLETLKGHVATLNRQLGAVPVSNLERVRLLIEDRPEWGRRIKEMLDFEDMPLFADPAKAEAAVNEIGALLDKHEQVHLADLFGLQFEVTTVGGRTMRYQNLDSVESNGTTITMKVLINVLMLRELLKRKDVRIPFYLDEASSLDHENLAAIVKFSSERGFVPILASPDPMEAATHLYFVAEQKGRVVLDPEKSKVTLRALAEEDPEGVS